MLLSFLMRTALEDRVARLGAGNVKESAIVLIALGFKLVNLLSSKALSLRLTRDVRGRKRGTQASTTAMLGSIPLKMTVCSKA